MHSQHSVWLLYSFSIIRKEGDRVLLMEILSRRARIALRRAFKWITSALRRAINVLRVNLLHLRLACDATTFCASKPYLASLNYYEYGMRICRKLFYEQ